jgi:hypothetical protein
MVPTDALRYAAWMAYASAAATVVTFVTGILQALLVVRLVRFKATLGTVLAAGGAFPGGLAWSGIAAGSGYILLVIGFWLGGQGHPLFWGGSLAALVGYATWAVWLGQMALSGELGLPR